MNYIYDIVLNIQDNYYNFFEWRREDKIRNIPKIPVYRVSDNDIMILKNNKVKVSQNFIEKMKDDNKRYKKLICLVSNGKMAIGLLFNNAGFLLKRSSLLFEEEDEVIDSVKCLEVISIEYIINEKVQDQNKLRLEKEKKDTLINYIKSTNDLLTLKYLYYEYYEEESEDISLIKNSLLKELENEWNVKQNNLYNVVNLLIKVK